MKTLATLVLAALASAAVAQSSLPACTGSYASRWTNCFGTKTDPNGDRYVGEWKKGKPHGLGTYSFSNGDIYIGEYRAGMQHGQGIYTFSDGDKYVGEFKNDRFHDRGTFFYLAAKSTSVDIEMENLMARVRLLLAIATSAPRNKPVTKIGG